MAKFWIQKDEPGHVFVVTANGRPAFGAHDGFNGVDDDFARDERVFHASVRIEMPPDMMMDTPHPL